MNNQDELFPQLKKMVVRGQPFTSKEAARHALRAMSDTKRKVLIALRDNGSMADCELHDYCCARFGRRAESSYRKRRTDLSEDGHVVMSGQIKIIDREKRVVWELSESGRQLLAEM